MSPRASNRRVEFIDAYRELVLERGERGATLDALATKVSASKGGLLHHFPSKGALVTGLCDRFRELVAADIAELGRSGMTPVEWYLGTSDDYTAPVERTMAALIRLAPMHETEVREVLRHARAQWYSIVLAEVGDELLAKTVILLGDGIAYNAESYGEGTTSQFTNPEVVEGAIALLQRARTQRSGDTAEG